MSVEEHKEVGLGSVAHLQNGCRSVNMMVDEQPGDSNFVAEPEENGDGEEEDGLSMVELDNDADLEYSQGIKEMFAVAHTNAPRCGKIQLEWMTIAQAAETLRMSKSVLSSWATRRDIATVKGSGANDHRLVHLDNILHFLARSIMSQEESVTDPTISKEQKEARKLGTSQRQFKGTKRASQS